ncbi:MAG: prefoldin subunit [Candidatus Woesearchaeota archaeon]
MASAQPEKQGSAKKQDFNSLLQQLQDLEQALQQYALQRQQLHAQKVEIESAKKALDPTHPTYKIIGNLMVFVPQEKIVPELNDQLEVLSLRIKSIEKQEQQLREKASALQQELLAYQKSSTSQFGATANSTQR